MDKPDQIIQRLVEEGWQVSFIIAKGKNPLSDSIKLKPNEFGVCYSIKQEGGDSYGRGVRISDGSFSFVEALPSLCSSMMETAKEKGRKSIANG